MKLFLAILRLMIENLISMCGHWVDLLKQGGKVSAESVTVSVVVPVYAGGNFIEELLDEIEKVKNDWLNLGSPIRLIEAILVDDAAIDDSPEIADRIAAEKDWVRVVHLARNFGQHPATIAGILHASGDWVVTLDEDLQHPPSKIELLLLNAVRNRSDIIYARATSNVHENRMRDLGSRMYKSLIEKITGNPYVGYFNSFRLIRGPVARGAASVCGPDTYFDLALSWFSQSVSSVEMELKDRRFILSGKSGYSFFGLVSHARRMLMSSGPRVLRATSLLGILIIVASMSGGIALVVHEFYAPASIFVRGWASVILAIVFLTGFIIFLVGIVLEYLAILVLHAHGKPIFFVVDRSTDAVLADHFKEAD